MSSYENDQRVLQKLMEEVLSESEDEPFAYSSDDYELSEYSSSDSDKPLLKKKNKVPPRRRIPAVSDNQPSTSAGVHSIQANDKPSEHEYSSSESDQPLSKKKRILPQIAHSATPVFMFNDPISQTIEDVVTNFRIDSSEGEEECLIPSLNWQEVTGEHLKTFEYNVKDPGVITNLFADIDKPPVYFFKLFLTDNLLDVMVTETNRYAAQKKNVTLLSKARINKWKDTNAQEMANFIGLQIWMGLVRLPKLYNYWSKNHLYANKVSNIMSRNRFELLLANWHFANNETADASNRLNKIDPLIDSLITSYKLYYVPKDQLCIDETLVPFRGRLSFLQYIKNKRHKFGVKLFKLCVEGGYTFDFRIYCGKEKNEKYTVPTSVVMNLCNNLLDSGRTVIVDNYYTSVELAHELLSRKTHLVGTLRKNRKNNPPDVIKRKLKRGESYSQESTTGIVITKWQDKREVLTLSTKHEGRMIKVTSGHNAEFEKPDSIVEYNNSKAFIDLSDQIKAYSSSLRKGIKWYRKIAVELLLGSAIVNAYLLYKTVTGNKLSITEFREQVAESLMNLDQNNVKEQPVNKAEKHYLQNVGTSHRRRCVACYARISSENGSAVAAKQTQQSRWKCNQCQKHYCVSCFCNTHECLLNP